MCHLITHFSFFLLNFLHISVPYHKINQELIIIAFMIINNQLQLYYNIITQTKLLFVDQNIQTNSFYNTIFST